MMLTKEQIDRFFDKDTIYNILKISKEWYCPDGNNNCLAAHANIPISERVAYFKKCSVLEALKIINSIISNYPDQNSEWGKSTNIGELIKSTFSQITIDEEIK